MLMLFTQTFTHPHTLILHGNLFPFGTFHHATNNET